MKETIFTKIVKGEIPSTKVYEDADFLAFLDIQPNNIGHTLLIPKEPYERLKDIPDELLEKLMVIVKKVSIAVEKGTGAKGINLSVNDGVIAGQEVLHFHLHIIPRFEDDSFKHGIHVEYESGEHAEEVGEKIRKELS
ncbi:MAG: histidine triad (HIT) family protein [Candidatus Paceibacteria bacterium]|jgi:histidine triad (HIT) family protein